jgi:hypothetical protein
MKFDPNDAQIATAKKLIGEGGDWPEILWSRWFTQRMTGEGEPTENLLVLVANRPENPMWTDQIFLIDEEGVSEQIAERARIPADDELGIRPIPEVATV